MTFYDVLYFIVVSLGSFLGTYLLLPKITAIVAYKKLMQAPNERSSHTVPISNLGGITFFIVFVLSIYFFREYSHGDIRITIVTGLVVLLFIGLKDDLVVISPLTKLAGQFIASFFIFTHDEFTNTNLMHFIGESHSTWYISAILSAFFMTYIINAFNLIDGIDGLASVIGLVAFASFGLLFYLVNEPFYLGLACSGFMMLLAFLKFNLTKDLKLKTFMGDTGSMIIGFIIAVFSLRILSLDSSELKALPLSSENIPILIIAILIVPLFDTSRVFTIRVMEGRKPFSADKSHIHHVLINKFKISHRKASFLIGLINILFAVLFFISAIKFNHLHLLFLLLFIIFLFVYFFYKINNALRK